MRSREREEACSLDSRGDLLTAIDRDHAVVAVVDDKRWRGDLREQGPNIDADRRLDNSAGVIVVRSNFLILRELHAADYRVGIRKHVREQVGGHAPLGPDNGEHSVAHVRRSAKRFAICVGAVNDELRYAVGVSCGGRERYRPAFRHATESKRFEAEVVCDGDDVLDPSVEGEVLHVAAGQATATLIHLNPGDPMCGGVDAQRGEEHGVKVEMADPSRNPDEGHALTLNGVGDADAVGSGDVADFAVHCGVIVLDCVRRSVWKR